MNFKKKLLSKIAQTLPEDLTTDETAKTTTVSGSPPTFIASDYYPGIIIGFGAKNIPWINGLTNILNSALYYTSNGQVQMSWLRSVNFNVSGDQSPSQDLKNIIRFSKQVYESLFTNKGKNYQQTLTTEQISEIVNNLKSSQFLSNLPTVSQNSQLSARIGGNLKTLINNYLLQIK